MSEQTPHTLPEQCEPAAQRAAPKPRDVEQVRNLLLDVAEAEFAQRGFHGARVRSIVKASGVNERMLYQQFESKEALYQAVLQRALSAVASEVRTVLKDADSRDPLEVLEEMSRKQFDAIVARPALGRLALHESLAGGKGFPRLDEADASLAEPLQRLVQRAVESGQLNPNLDPTLVLTVADFMFLTFPLALARLSRSLPVALDTPEGHCWAREQIVSMVIRAVKC